MYDIPPPQQNRSVDDEIAAASHMYGSNGAAQLVEAMTKDQFSKEVTEDKIFQHFFAANSNTTKLTFIEQEDLEEFELLWDNSKIDFLQFRTAKEITGHDINMLNQMRLYFHLAMRRSKGFKTQRTNERTLQASQIHQIHRSNTESLGDGFGKGVFGGFKRWFK